MLVCPQCSSENPVNHKFCQACGFPLVCRWAVVTNKSSDDGEITTPQPNDRQSSLLYLGARYKQVDTETKTLSTDARLVKVLDSLPNHPSPIQDLMNQQPPVVDDRFLGKLPTDFPEWELWERGGVSPAARPYLALQPLLSDHIPKLYDAWDRNGQTVLILAIADNQVLLESQCQNPQYSSAELAQWCECLLELWTYLQPWSVRSSLLEIDNLYIDEQQTIYLQRLIPETDLKPVALLDLIQVWLRLLPESPLKESIRQSLQIEEITPESLLSHLQADPQPDPADTYGLDQPLQLLGLKAAAATDVGRQRDHNEDFYSIETSFSQIQNPQKFFTTGRGLYILCDGMGGHAAGEVASSMAIAKLQAYWAEHWQDTLPTEQEIQEAIIFANQALFEVNQTNAAAGNGRMGTTLVMVMVQDNQIAIAHVGDSRCYILEASSSLVQITLDHEVGQREILRGVEPEVAYGRPDSYQLTQAIGPRDENSIAPDIQFFGLREDTLILVASDGLTDRDLLEIHGENLLRPIIRQEISISAGINTLVEFGNNYNGHDNITAIGILVQIGK